MCLFKKQFKQQQKKKKSCRFLSAFDNLFISILKSLKFLCARRPVNSVWVVDRFLILDSFIHILFSSFNRRDNRYQLRFVFFHRFYSTVCTYKHALVFLFNFSSIYIHTHSFIILKHVSSCYLIVVLLMLIVVLSFFGFSCVCVCTAYVTHTNITLFLRSLSLSFSLFFCSKNYIQDVRNKKQGKYK